MSTLHLLKKWEDASVVWKMYWGSHFGLTYLNSSSAVSFVYTLSPISNFTYFQLCIYRKIVKQAKGHFEINLMWSISYWIWDRPLLTAVCIVSTNIQPIVDAISMWRYFDVMQKKRNREWPDLESVYQIVDILTWHGKERTCEWKDPEPVY